MGKDKIKFNYSNFFKYILTLGKKVKIVGFYLSEMLNYPFF